MRVFRDQGAPFPHISHGFPAARRGLQALATLSAVWSSKKLHWAARQILPYKLFFQFDKKKPLTPKGDGREVSKRFISAPGFIPACVLPKTNRDSAPAATNRLSKDNRHCHLSSLSERYYCSLSRCRFRILFRRFQSRCCQFRSPSPCCPDPR